MSFRQRIAQFFYGRYGIDSLYYGLLVTILILWILRIIFIDSIAAGVLVYILETVLLFWMLYRCMSRNTAARQRENQAFTSFFKKNKNFLILKLTAIKRAPTAKRRSDCPNEKVRTPSSALVVRGDLT